MIKLSARLERRLKDVFSRAKEREKFASDIIEEALDKNQSKSEVEMVGGTLHLFTDGGSRGNPGQAAIGCVIEDPVEGKIIREHAERIGIQTNNVAEYRALIEGLKIARRYHPNRLVCFMDSELIVKQLKGEYRVKMDTLREFVEEIKELVEEFASVEFHYIPRADNFRADTLVNKSLDEHPSPSYEKSE
ncbi:MAG: ribonuclease HI family protein [Candidatus Peribacteraceae bacterium]|nr:ribonuclease HI family protein [Candidatus Peribacteraceae bacterium]MDP7454263.1 ribonuclease HI family protein [Candidatus Peribacteraceae bacterium]MDP7645753.1 ribonuclease HI family protein [Candidatus Peribacteraceae bacterium]